MESSGSWDLGESVDRGEVHAAASTSVIADVADLIVPVFRAQAQSGLFGVTRGMVRVTEPSKLGTPARFRGQQATGRNASEVINAG
jgi:hypothetical protein